MQPFSFVMYEALDEKMLVFFDLTSILALNAKERCDFGYGWPIVLSA